MLFNLNKPKLAVLIVGEYRTFKYCRKTMTFLDQKNLNIDVYFSTWDKTNIVNDKYNPVYREVTVKQIEEDIGIPNASIHIHQANPNSFIPMIDGWILGFDLVRNSNIKYDYILVLRPDLFFKESIDLFFKELHWRYWPFNIFKISTLSQYKDGVGVRTFAKTIIGKSVDDAIFFSTYDNLNKLLSKNIVDYIKNNSNGEHITAPEMHHMWYDYITNYSNLKIYELPIRRECLIARYPMAENLTFTDVELIWENAWKECHGKAHGDSQ